MQSKGRLSNKAISGDNPNEQDIESIEKRLEKQQRESILRLYSGSGTIFLSPKQGRWSFYFKGNHVNAPTRKMKPGEVWKEANGVVRLKFFDAFQLMQFLWKATSNQLMRNERLEIRIGNKSLLAAFSEKKDNVMIRYLDNTTQQCTLFLMSQHHLLDLYLGMLAVYRFMTIGRFGQLQNQKEEKGKKKNIKHINLLTNYTLGKNTISVVLRHDSLTIRHTAIQDKNFKAYRKDACMLSHVLSAHLYRQFKKTQKVGENKIFIALPQMGTRQDVGKIILGPFNLDFSAINISALVAIHLGSAVLIDGLPTHMFR